jgi:catechol 2,3-dioxygenase-like lactoylglutathione lyase family enzyme
MLKDNDSTAIVAVSDLDRARAFYERTLGLPLQSSETSEVLVFKTGATTLTVYPSEFAGTNKANAVVWDVGEELDAIMRDLKAKGAVFEHYDLPGLELQGDVHVSGAFRGAWLKDPDGNILHFVST